MNDFDTLCRICLCNGAAIPIFDTRDEFKDIYQRLSLCLCEKIEDIARYPRNICETCYMTVNDIIAFHNRYKKTCEILKQSLEVTYKQDLELNSEVIIKQEFEDLSSHSFGLSDVELDSTKCESKIIFSDAKQFKKLVKPLVTKYVKKEPRTRNRQITKSPTKKINSKVNTSRQLNSRIYSSILEGEFDFAGEQWCLKPPNKSAKENQTRKEKLVNEPKTVKENSALTCEDNIPLKWLQKNKDPAPRLCELCGSTFDNSDKLNRHKNRHHHTGTAVKCSICSKTLCDQVSLRKHIRRCHSDESKFVCEVCGKGFTYKNELHMHNKIVHLKQKRAPKCYPCKLCDKKYVTAKSLLMHERAVHTGERPAVCSVCDSRFTHDDYLKEHMRLHTGETPFKCPVCGRGYAQRCNMRSHVKHIHRISQLNEEMLKTIKPIYLRLMKP